MWNRIQYDTWVDVVPVIAFILTFSVFLVLTTRAFLMKRPEAKRLAQLPLEGDEPASDSTDSPSQS